MSKIGRGNPFPPDSPTISLALTTLNVVEGSTNNITVTRTSSTLASTCLVYTKPGTASEADFTPHNGTLVSFSSGETSKNVSLIITADVFGEVAEKFSVFIANPVNAVIGNNELVVTIAGDSAPAATVTNVTSAGANEGDAIVHTVTLSSNSGGSFPFSIANNTTTNGDYSSPVFGSGVTLVGGNAIVPNGVSSFSITVNTIEDATVEANETYTITIGGFVATGTIINDDFVTIVSVSSPTITEGDLVTFNVALSGASVGQVFTFTQSGEATASVDYAQPFTFSNGVTRIDNTISVPTGVSSFTVSTLTTNDTDIESNETIVLTIGGVTGTATIADNDTPPVTLDPLTDIVVFEAPYEMLTSGQRTAVATTGGFAMFAVSRNDIAAAVYDVYYSATEGGTYNKVSENNNFTASGEIVGSIPYDHQTLTVTDLKDFPADIVSNTAGLIVDSSNQREFCMLNKFSDFINGGDTAKILSNVGVACFDSVPIQVPLEESARVFVLTNRAIDTTVRADGSTGYYKVVPKTSSGTFPTLNTITPIALTITSKARLAKPNPPRMIEFGHEVYQKPNMFYLFPAYIGTAGLLVRFSPSSKIDDIPPSSFFKPSGLNEAGVIYKMDVEGLNGVSTPVRTITGNLGTGLFTYSDQGIDGSRLNTKYTIYAEKAGVKSNLFVYELSQAPTFQAPINVLALSQSSSNILATATLDTPSSPRNDAVERAVAFVQLSGTLAANVNMAGITGNQDIEIMHFSGDGKSFYMQYTGGITGYVLTIPFTGTGTLTVKIGHYDGDVKTQSITIA